MPQAAEKTMDEEMADDWAEIRARHAVDDDREPIKEKEPPAEEAPAAEEAPPATETRQRDETGKFTRPERGKPAPKPQPSEPDAPNAARGSNGAAPAAQSQAQPRDLNRAPSTWRPAVRAEWQKLPEGVRAEVLKREQDFHNGQQQLAPDAQLGRSMRQTIEPYRMLIEAEGGTPEKAVESLLRTAATFRVGTPQQKYEAWAQIGRQYLGIELNQPQGQQATAQPAFQDPRVDQLLAYQRQQDTNRQREAQAELERGVNSWMAQANQDGTPKYPYLQDVIAEMSALLPQIKEASPHLTTAQVLEEGYQRAVWANPEIRALLQHEAASEHDAKQRSDNQTRVRDAKRAASVNVPRRASIPAPAKPGRLEETIAETARELGLIS